jgi:hypothetical protein
MSAAPNRFKQARAPAGGRAARAATDLEALVS